jgi:hypothetical protein
MKIHLQILIRVTDGGYWASFRRLVLADPANRHITRAGRNRCMAFSRLWALRYFKVMPSRRCHRTASAKALLRAMAIA